jgi:hypothetical protein
MEGYMNRLQSHILGGLLAVTFAVTGAQAAGLPVWKVPAEIVAQQSAELLDQEVGNLPSTRFAEVYAYVVQVKETDFGGKQEGYIICGRLNTKNGFGGYTGWTRFAVTKLAGWYQPPILYLGTKIEGIAIPDLCDPNPAEEKKAQAIRDNDPDYALLVGGKKRITGD